MYNVRVHKWYQVKHGSNYRPYREVTIGVQVQLRIELDALLVYGCIPGRPHCSIFPVCVLLNLQCLLLQLKWQLQYGSYDLRNSDMEGLLLVMLCRHVG